jgi:Trk-type K+ transport system membrane component
MAIERLRGLMCGFRKIIWKILPTTGGSISSALVRTDFSGYVENLSLLFPVFELVSAYGTVGLSLGIPDVSGTSRYIYLRILMPSL